MLRAPHSIAFYTAFVAAGPAHAQSPDPRDEAVSGTTSPLAPALEHPPELLPPPRIELVQARRLMDRGRHVEAAKIFESLHRETGDPRFLYHAGLARLRAGQAVLAIQHFKTAISLLATPSDAVRLHVDAKISEAAASLIPVRVVVRESISGTWQPVPVGHDPRITVESADVAPLTVNVVAHLHPGRWRLRADIPGYVPVTLEQTFDPGVGERVWEVTLTRKTHNVELRFAPPKLLRRARLELTATDRFGVPPVERTLDGPRLNVPLTTGTWQLAVTSPRGQASQTLVVADDPRPVDIVLQPHKAPTADHFAKHRKLVLGVAVAMGVNFYLGVGLSVGGTNIASKAEKKDLAAREDAGVGEDERPDAAALAAIEAAYPTAKLHDGLRRGAALTTAGTVVMMTGLGTVLGILPSLLQSRRRAAWIGLGIGGAALVGGSVWMHDYTRLNDARLAPTDPEHRQGDIGLTGHRLGAAMILGLGLGLTTGTALLLLTERVHRRKQRLRSVAPYALPGQAGLLLRGAF